MVRPCLLRHLLLLHLSRRLSLRRCVRLRTVTNVRRTPAFAVALRLLGLRRLRDARSLSPSAEWSSVMACPTIQRLSACSYGAQAGLRTILRHSPVDARERQRRSGPADERRVSGRTTATKRGCTHLVLAAAYRAKEYRGVSPSSPSSPVDKCESGAAGRTCIPRRAGGSAHRTPSCQSAGACRGRCCPRSSLASSSSLSCDRAGLARTSPKSLGAAVLRLLICRRHSGLRKRTVLLRERGTGRVREWGRVVLPTLTFASTNLDLQCYASPLLLNSSTGAE
jgi:hypothetical protein